jgi:MTH538 TIR-like domain (DUF1863)
MPGINRALYENRTLAKSRQLTETPCIFLSHISVDKASAVTVGDYIAGKGDIDIYLDINDPDLQNAVSSNDPAGVTRFIERGLSVATHIMCLVSEATVRSWWVPYELGFAKNAGKHLATLKLKGTVDLPAYLAISEIIRGTESLNSYLTRVRRRLAKGTTLESLTETLIRHTAPQHPLDPHLDWNA